MMQSTLAGTQNVSVMDVEKEEITSFVRSMVSDSHLRARFLEDPAAALESSGVMLSPSTRAAVLAQAPDLLRATEGIDNPTAAFFAVIIIHTPK